MSLEELERVRDEIQGFSKIHQEQVYKLLRDGGAEVQETSQGVLVNLGALADKLLEDVINYTKHVRVQEKHITADEIAKDVLRENYFGASAEQA
jgi:hypothetical protein